MSKEINELIRTPEAGKMLGVDVRTVHDLIEDDKLKAFHIRTKGEKLPWRYWVLKRDVERMRDEGWRERRQPQAKVSVGIAEHSTPSESEGGEE